MSVKIEASYLRPVFEVAEFKKIIDRAVNALRLFDAHTPFDSIAFCGMSGASLAYPLSYLMGKHLMCVRKMETIESHAWQEVEGIANPKSYVIVDDCVDSGNTLKRIQKGVGNHCDKNNKPTLVGIYLFLEAWQTKNSRRATDYLDTLKAVGVQIVSVPFEERYL